MSIASDLALAKTGIDTLRGVVGLVRDMIAALPAGANKDAVGKSLEDADRKIALAEAQIAHALGFELCRCEFPPTPMTLVGYQQHRGKTQTFRRDVFQCLKCKRTKPPGGYSTNSRTFVLGD